MLELQGDATGLLDDPLAPRVRGLGGPGADGGADGAAGLRWRARLHDDDGRVWRAEAARAAELAAAFAPASPDPRRPLAALRSLRPVRIEVRAEASDGRAAARTFTRALVGEGVRVRRWSGVLPGAAATLHRPAGAPCATVVLDAAGASARADAATEQAGAVPAPAELAALAAPLLASRGVLALTLAPGGGRRSRGQGELLDAAIELLAAVPGAAPADRIVTVAPPLAPGVPALAPGDPAAWDALLARLGARPRG